MQVTPILHTKSEHASSQIIFSNSLKHLKNECSLLIIVKF
jgi:hypothetical protein